MPSKVMDMDMTTEYECEAILHYVLYVSSPWLRVEGSLFVFLNLDSPPFVNDERPIAC